MHRQLIHFHWHSPRCTFTLLFYFFFSFPFFPLNLHHMWPPTIKSDSNFKLLLALVFLLQFFTFLSRHFLGNAIYSHPLTCSLSNLKSLPFSRWVLDRLPQHFIIIQWKYFFCFILLFPISFQCKSRKFVQFL